MSDHSKLKVAAEFVLSDNLANEFDAVTAFRAEATPSVVLGLIAENERISGENQRLRAGVESDMAEIDRIQAVYDAHFRTARSYRMQRDAAMDESAELKAECEGLRKDADRWQFIRDVWPKVKLVPNGEWFNSCFLEREIDAAMSKESGQ